MKPSDNGGVLRNISLGAQPRALQRSRAPLQLAPRVHDAPAAGQDIQGNARELEAALAAGHAEGLARGREEGYRAGYGEGAAAAQQRVEEAVRAARAAAEAEAEKSAAAAVQAQAAIAETLAETCAGFERAAGERLAGLEIDAIELAFAAVCKIVADDGRAREQVERVVKAALQSLRGAKLLRVRLNADDLAHLDAAARLRATASLPGSVEWVADSSVATGGCILDCERGSVDARLQVQLERLRRQWVQVAQAARSAGETSAP